MRLTLSAAFLSLALAVAGPNALAQGEGNGKPAVQMPADGDTSDLIVSDRLSLAGLLVGDGYYDRALTVLSDIDPSAEDLDRVRFYTLRGLARLNRDDPAGARDDFRDSITAGQDKSVIYVYLGQAHFRLQEYADALDAIDKAGSAAAEYPSLYILRAESHWKLDQPVGAFRALEAGVVRFPDNNQFLRRQVFYMMELGTYQSAAELGRRYLGEIEGGPEDYLAIAVALHRGGESDEALSFLEYAQLRFPENTKITQALAQVYFDTGRGKAAADVYEKAAAVHPELTHEAAEFHRRAGQLFRALNLNARVRDPKEKMRQRVAILVELERYEQVAGAQASLNRVGLLEDQNIRYALAYSLFKAGKFDAAEAHLSRLTKGELVRQATQLRQYMQECRSDPWLCA